MILNLRWNKEEIEVTHGIYVDQYTDSKQSDVKIVSGETFLYRIKLKCKICKTFWI